MPDEQSPRTAMAAATAAPYVWGDPQPERPPRSWKKSAGLVAVAVVAAAGATYLITTNGASGTTGTGPGGGFPGGFQTGGPGGQNSDQDSGPQNGGGFPGGSAGQS